MIVQAVSWAAVAWLLTVHVLVERGRLPQHGRAARIAATAAAASVVAAAVVTRFWPLAALGLLWLRTEVFAHRVHPLHLPDPARLLHPVGRVIQVGLAVLLRIEIVVIVVVLLVVLTHWTRQHTADFNRRSDRVLCGLVSGDC